LLSSIDARPPPLAVIFGIAGESLSPDEAAFFRESNPLGFILFARNCKDPVQLKALVRSLQDLLGREVPVLIDQEGGRVERLKPPHWNHQPAAADQGEQAGEVSAAIAADLGDLGINVNCAPVLDVRHPQTHNSLGDRAYSTDPVKVGEKGAQACRAFLQGGVIPVIKHLPGLGRAHLDTHHDLPAVAAAPDELGKTDFAPFRHVLKQDFAAAVWGMVSHAVFDAVDPGVAASCSPKVIENIIRKTIGFDGLLLSDDLSMGALSQYGDAAARAAKVLAAGCDIALHCNGNLDEMKLVANAVPLMTNEAVVRYNRSVASMGEFMRKDAA
jgi:beta-N-acetylhexosaminidase